MRNPQVVLDNLSSKSNDQSYVYKRIYRNLYNLNFYLAAYEGMYANSGNMTAGTDKKTIDGMSLTRVNTIINKIKDESYLPTPVRRIHIPKKSGGKRPLGIPTIDDKLIQTVIKDILESIYDGCFAKESHGFRPNKSCHTALGQIERTFKGTKWFIEGDIKGFFDNIDHHILINILRKKIKDEKFIRIIWKFLRAGYLDQWRFHNTYSGTPQGGIISPILSNIYLNELDIYMKKFKQKFDIGKARKANKEYEQFKRNEHYWKKRLNGKSGPIKEDEKEIFLQNIKEARKRRVTLPSKDQMDTGFKRIQYVRYADDFLVGIIGSKEDAKLVKSQLTSFIHDNLKLELSQEKTLITHGAKQARFLGYDICISKTNNFKKVEDKNGKKYTMRNITGKVRLSVPKEAWVGKLLQIKVLKMNGSVWSPIHRTSLINLDDLEILSIYNAQIRGLYEYYRLAINCSVLNKFYYFMEYSMYKTFANKYKGSIGKVKKKFNIKGEFGIKYQTKKGVQIRLFYNNGFKRNNYVTSNHTVVDREPNTQQYSAARTSLISRLTAQKCEWCGTSGIPLEIHHVRKLKDLKRKRKWERTMIARRRKTLALSATGHGNECHKKLHAGLLD
jgi:group II intron reverse transcriptase/maturase